MGCQWPYGCWKVKLYKYWQALSCLVVALILETPAHPVMEGESVTLFCKTKMAFASLATSFYKDDIFIGTNSMGNMTISTVYKSHEGSAEYHELENHQKVGCLSKVRCKCFKIKPLHFILISVHFVVNLYNKLYWSHLNLTNLYHFSHTGSIVSFVNCVTVLSSHLSIAQNNT